MKKRILSTILAFVMILTLVTPAAVFATDPENTYNGETIPFSDWAACGIGSWAQTSGVLAPVDITDFNMIRFGTALGQTYTVEMDVKQADTTSGWQTIQIGFDVNAGENFTQSGLVLDLHNAGVARVVTYANMNDSSALGSYANPFGGNGAYTGTTNWFHVSIARSGSSYTVTIDNGTPITFTTSDYNGGYLVLGAVGSREVEYKNVTITTPQAIPENTYNSATIPFSDWTACGIGTWSQTNGVLLPATITEYNMLRFNTALSKNYTIDMDIKQADTTSGWQTIQLGFDVNPGENFTQSGLVLDLHNAGVARVITYANKDGSGLGSYATPYGGNIGYVGTTSWFHVQIARAGSNYTVTVNNGTPITFTTGDFNGGYLVLGAVGNRDVRYKNVTITDTPTNTFNGSTIPFSSWTACGIGTWSQTNGILVPDEITEYNMLRFDTALTKYYTVDMDIKQADTTSGWQTIMLGFDVNPGENFTQSGLVLDMHNAGVARVITFANKDNSGAPGSYSNPYGTTIGYGGNTDWFHVQIVRNGSSYTVTVRNTPITFTTNDFNGGYLVLGAIGNREVEYKNVTITAHVHTYQEIETVNPTCTQPGSIEYECTGCGETMIETIPATGQHNYVNGVCTVCGADEPILKIKSASLRLDEDIDVIYTVLIPDGYTDPYMVINGTTITASEAAGDYRQFTYTGMTPQRMTDNISATLYATIDGVTESVSVANYSIKQYCANQLAANPNNEALVTLLSDLLTYGAAAQTYTNYNANNLATSGLALSPSTFSAISGKSVSFTGTADANTYWTEATLVLGNTVGMRFYFVTNAQISIDVTINNSTETYDSGFVSCGNGKYYIDIPGINATDFDTTVSAAFYDNGVQVGNTLNYTVNAYICGTQNSPNATLQALVRALYNYGASAAAYAAN